MHTPYALQDVTSVVKVLEGAVTTSEEEGEFTDIDVSFESSQSIYIPTPQKNLWANRISLSVPMPDRVCFVELKQLDSFVQQLNACRRCATPGCSGDLVPSSVKLSGLGGAVSITFTCAGCLMHHIPFESSLKCDGTTKIGVAVQVAFIVAGCTHATYYKALRYALGIDAVCGDTFMSTIVKMYPVVKQLLDEMCEEAKADMKAMDQSQLGSWSRGVTSADGTWMTRGHHSKNATFSVRNYLNGALLYYAHLSQKGRDKVIQEELYQGTSKSAEGYGARLTLKKAKEEGLHIEVHWQDADSSSSNVVAEHFSDAKVMICGGHAGRAHKKQLENFTKMKSFSNDFKSAHSKRYPQVRDVVCHCSRHSVGCGCLSNAFIEKARNNFSFILSESQSPEEFSSRLRLLPRHARDQHEWDGGQCDFHPLKVCSCGKCEDRENFVCEGKDYHTKHILSCPLHSLAYEIECDRRADMADVLVHPVLKRGHSNWLEASHNVFIRFRSKHINLERLHYATSTNLGLLQSNMTYMYSKHGPSYHWVPELFRRLGLPVFEGLQDQLEALNRKRKAELDKAKTEAAKRHRIQLKRDRVLDSQRRKEWSKAHGRDTYGSDDEADTVQKVGVKRKCRCGSTTHSLPTHRDCPMNKKRKVNVPVSLHDNVAPCESSDSDMDITPVVYLSSNSSLDDSGDEWLDDEDLMSGSLCLCGALNRAHKAFCPMSSRNRSSRVLFVADNLGPAPSNKPGLSKSEKSNNTIESDKSRVSERDDSSVGFKPGDCVFVHSRKALNNHVRCRIVEVVGKFYRLCCMKGALNGRYSSEDLTASSKKFSLPLFEWRQSPAVSLCDVVSDPACLERCNCTRSKSPLAAIDLTGDSEEPDHGRVSAGDHTWLKNELYTLNNKERETIESPSGWLNDNIISAAQMLLLQQFPHMSGLQPPTLAQAMAFQVHRGEFVQILCVGNNHWCTVSNVGCDDGVVNVYDSMYYSVSSTTMYVIASLLLTSAPKLVIRMMDVGEQTNGSDCGILSIAFAYEICSGNNPCKAKYNHKSTRQHLLKCLEECHLSRFPLVGERRHSTVKHIEEIEIHCSCRMPEVEGRDVMAQCDSCNVWYHQHCMDIPKEVFGDSEVQWVCKKCKC